MVIATLFAFAGNSFCSAVRLKGNFKRALFVLAKFLSDDECSVFCCAESSSLSFSLIFSRKKGCLWNKAIDAYFENSLVCFFLIFLFYFIYIFSPSFGHKCASVVGMLMFFLEILQDVVEKFFVSQTRWDRADSSTKILFKMFDTF